VSAANARSTSMRRIQQASLAALALIVSGALSGCAVYRKCGLAGCPGDAQITAAVRAQFRLHPALEPPNLLHVQTLDHVVYLTGQVDTEVERSMAQSLALEVAGVARVVNSINFGYEGR
jgi:osmotically-inducible protein OsmY